MIQFPRSFRALSLPVLIFAVAFGAADTARADTILTNGTLTVTLRSDNGAIHSVTFPNAGSEFYRLGAFVSDFGIQTGTNTGTFAINTTNGGEGISGTLPSGSPTFTGTYTSGGANVGVSRTYSIVAGLDVLRTVTTLTNNGTSPITLRLFDTFDPDQGVPFDTINDVYTLSGFNVARATDSSTALTVLYGDSTNASVLGFGTGTSPFGLGISNGAALNTFFLTPFDPNGANQDVGFAIGREFTLGVGQSITVGFDQAFGTSQADAEGDFLAAVPEPATLVLSGLAALGLAGFGLRRRRATAA